MGVQALDVAGQVFGRLSVLRRVANQKRHVRFECRCECGEVVEVRGAHLRFGKTKSCGCWNNDARKGNTRGKTHGLSHTLIHHVWTSMIQRCHNLKQKHYSDYGGRGIKVDESWRGAEGFQNFLDHVGPRPSAQHSLDRYPNNNGNYEPGNVRWATRSQQQKNRRKIRALGNFTDQELKIELKRRGI